MPEPRPGEKILIFAPHEDDETLGCGGYIQQAVAAKADVSVELLTNGDYARRLVISQGMLLVEPTTFSEMGYQRQRETLAALAYLGLPPDRVTFLGYPCHYLDQMWLPAHWLPANPVRSISINCSRSPYKNSMTPGAIFCGQSLLQDIEKILLRESPDTVITMHPNDVHVDHWPTFAFVRLALDELSARGEEFAAHCRVYTYLVHRKNWPEPSGYHPLLPLYPPVPLLVTQQTEWLTLPLTVAQTTKKHKAITLYKSQDRSIYYSLQSFSRSNELFGIIPLRVWTLARDVPPVQAIVDPVSDLVSSKRNANADVRQVLLGRKGDRMLVLVETPAIVTNAVSFHVTIHASGAKPADIVIAQFDWNGKSCSGLILKKGALHTLGKEDCQTTSVNNVSTLDVPWPLSDSSVKHFIVRAWTTRGDRQVDQTALSDFSIETAAPAVSEDK
jgi:LmbE family N-acetylglucosaminyl deacetylase